MQKSRWEWVLRRALLTLAMLGLSLVISACYKDAGEDLQPTSRQVINLTDIAPTATPTVPMPTQPLALTATRTLVPTTTPAVPVLPTTVAPTATAAELQPPTNTPTAALSSTPAQFSPSFTPLPISPTPTEIGITTPSMSDILPSDTPVPTIDPAHQPTPTAIPIEENPCIHVVQPGDTLFSIATENEVTLDALVAANAQYLGGSAYTPLQIGWALQIPGCGEPTPTVTPTGSSETAPNENAPPSATPASGEVIHTVQPGEGIYSIARQYGVSPQAIIDANGLANPNLIHPGDQLIIPLGQ